VLGAINVPIAGISGLVQGAISPDIKAFEQARKNIKSSLAGEEFRGFSDVIREEGEVTSRGGKIGAGVLGFGLDVLLDPLTYITLGASVATKVARTAGKTLTRGGSKYYTRAVREAGEKLGKESATASKDIVERSIRNNNYDTLADDLIKVGTSPGTAELLTRTAKAGRLIDNGGIKFLGRSMIKGETIAKSTLGKTAKELGGLTVVKNAREVFNKTFKFNKVSKPLARMVEGYRAVSNKVMNEIVELNKGLWKGTTPAQRKRFFDTIEEQKKNIIPSDENILKGIKAKGLRDTVKNREAVESSLRKQLKATQRADAEAIVTREFADDPQLQDIARRLFIQDGDQPAITKQIAKMAGLDEDSAIALYVPSITKIDSEKLSPLVRESTFGGVEAGFLKKFKGTSQHVVRDAAEAYTMGMISVANARMRTNLLKSVERAFGIPKGKMTAAQAKRAGFVLFDKKIVPEVWDAKVWKEAGENLAITDDKISQILRTMKDVTGDEAKNVKKIKELMTEVKAIKGVARHSTITQGTFNKLINKAGRVDELKIANEDLALWFRHLENSLLDLRSIKKSAKDLPKPYKVEAWIPESIKAEMDSLINPSYKEINDMFRKSGFDWMTGLFKSYVTSPFIGFHVRNLSANEMNNMLFMGVDVFDVRLQKMAADMALGRNMNRVVTNKFGEQATLSELLEEITNRSTLLGQGQFGSAELGAETVQRSLSGKGKFDPLSQENIVLKTGRAVGGKVEDQGKLAHILSSWRAGNTVDNAIESAEKALFNYSKLTPIEKTFFRRLIPFYTFMRKNAELQINMLAKKPGFIAGELKGFEALGDIIGEPITAEDYEGMPPWIKDTLGMKVAENKFGQPVYLTGFGLPIEEFLGKMSGDQSIMFNIFKNILEGVNPIVKFPLEKATGVDIFRGKPIQEITNADSVAWMEEWFNVMPQGAADELKDFMKWRVQEVPEYRNGVKVGSRKKYTADAEVLHFLRNLPSARFQSVAGKLHDPKQTNTSKVVNTLTGARLFPIDKEQQKRFNELDDKQELERFLIQMLNYRTFDILTPPKSNKTTSRSERQR